MIDRPQADTISLVAVLEETLVGHIMFSGVVLDGSRGLHLMGLAPVAVVPSHQRRGVGAALVREGLAQCRVRGVSAGLVLGHPTYYPRFGFRPAFAFGIRCAYEVPPEAFMLQELREGALACRSGTTRYSRSFDQT